MKKFSLKKSYVILMIFGSFATLEAFDIKYNGWLESFSKIGFNNQPIDVNLGRYPTDTFVNVIGSFGFSGNILPATIQNHKLFYGFSVTGGSMIVDSSSKQYPGGANSVNSEYVGMWLGYDLQGDPATKRHYYVFNNAYLDYTLGNFADDTLSFRFKGGRYRSSAEYMSGYTQGFEVAFRAKFSDTQSLNLWWFSSYGRAFAFGQWLIDFYSPRGYMSNGKFINNGIHAFKATYSFGGLDVIPYVYFSPGTYLAPAIRFVYDTNREFNNQGFRSQTFINFIAPINERGIGKYRYGDLVERYTQNLFIKQQFNYNNYNFGLGIYKNFGNANAWIGTNGNPLQSVLDFWTASSYDLGRSISDMIGKDAITPFLFVGGVHYRDKVAWGIVGRFSESRRSQEQSIAGSIKYKFEGGLSVGAKIEYYNDITKEGYRVGSNGDNTAANGPYQPTTTTSTTSKNIADRSHAFVWVHYDF